MPLSRLFALLVGLAAITNAQGANPTTVTVTGGPKDATYVVVKQPVPADTSASLMLKSATSPDKAIPAVAHQGMLTFVVPSIKAGETLTFSVAPATDKSAPRFEFSDRENEFTDLKYAGQPVTRFITKKHDGSTPQSHELSFKPFHHVYDPAGGELITSGAYPTSDKSKLFPHHRGIFFGWMKAGYNGKLADTWHGRKGVYSEIERELEREANEVFARQKVLIRWIGEDGLQFAEEERQLTAYAIDGGTLLDFEAQVSTKLPKVTLDGDPQHSGVHFRAAQDVAKNKAKTVYTRPDGADMPGKTRNWPNQKEHVNLPWNAMTFTANDKQYTTVLVDRPENPKEARWSEREYGRFGSYFVAEVTPAKPLTLKYRFFIKAGPTTVSECETIAAGAASGAKVEVK